MKYVVAAMIMITVSCGSSASSHRSVTAPLPLDTRRGVAVVPNRHLTPGEADKDVTDDNVATTICTKGWSTAHRPPKGITEPIKRQQMRAYGYANHKLGDFELDHLIPLELGGATTQGNLWPEPWERQGNKLAAKGQGAESKDVVENRLHAAVCSGEMKLTEAQHRIAANWRNATP